MVYWGPYYTKTIKALMDGTWKGEQRTIWGKPEGANDVIKIADFVPAELKAKAEAANAGIKAGTLEVFTGPIVGSDGKERLAKDTKADQAWKDKVDFYVKGVEGKIPSGK
jgi:simple sugar transport system substrate-binding protein